MDAAGERHGQKLLFLNKQPHLPNEMERLGLTMFESGFLRLPRLEVHPDFLKRANSM
jgi:hypothetical protein